MVDVGIDRIQIVPQIEKFLAGFLGVRGDESQKDNCEYCLNAFQSIPGLHLTKKIPGEFVGEYNMEFTWSGVCGSKPVYLHAWMDDVPAPMESENQSAVSEGYIHGTGAVAGKGGVAAIYGLMMELSSKNIRFPFDIKIHLTVGHRRNGEGCAALAAETDGQAVLLMEPTGGNIVTHHAGNLWLKLTSTGVACHSSVQQFGVGRNALTALFELLELMKEKYDAYAGKTDGTYTMCFNVGSFAAGVWPSALCPEAVAQVAMVLDASQEASLLVEEYMRMATDYGVQVEELRKWACGGTKELDATLAKLPDCLHKGGLAGNVAGSSEALEIGIYQSIAKVPCVAFGPSDISVAGTAKEKLSKKALLDTIQAIMNYLKEVE